MKSTRLEAFSDGVIAIIITIMVLELKVPHGGNIEHLRPLLPVFLSYVLSFIYIAIYWNNHHHMMHTVEKVNGRILWANMHLLFWLSLIPFVTGWMGENYFQQFTLTLYGCILLMCAIAFTILQTQILNFQGKDSKLRIALGSDRKGKISLFCYVCAIAISIYSPSIAGVLYIIVALIWFIPDKRIERIYRE